MAGTVTQYHSTFGTIRKLVFSCVGDASDGSIPSTTVTVPFTGRLIELLTAPAGVFGRQIESGADSAKLEAMEKAGRLKRIPFADRAQMKKLADPVMAEYAKEIGATEIYNKINAM